MKGLMTGRLVKRLSVTVRNALLFCSDYVSVRGDAFDGQIGQNPYIHITRPSRAELLPLHQPGSVVQSTEVFITRPNWAEPLHLSSPGPRAQSFLIFITSPNRGAGEQVVCSFNRILGKDVTLTIHYVFLQNKSGRLSRWKPKMLADPVFQTSHPCLHQINKLQGFTS